MNFCGKPLIAWSIEQAKKSACVNEVFVSTDSKEIASVSTQYGAKVIWRPEEYASDTATSESALLHALEDIEKKYAVETIVFLQATSPVRREGDIDAAVTLFTRESADSLLSVSDSEDAVFLWEKDGDSCRSVTYDFRSRPRRQDAKRRFMENGSIYIMRPDILRTTKNRLGGRIAIYPMPFWCSFQIDSKEDIDLCAFFMKTKVLNQKQGTIRKENIGLIVYDFDGVMTNNQVLLDEYGRESVSVSRADGLAVSEIRKLGLKQIILSTEKSPVVHQRAQKLGIECIQGVGDKKKALDNYCVAEQIQLKNVVYVGNDINDAQVMGSVGYPVCPVDAAQEILDLSIICLGVSGGEGVVRELLNVLVTDS